MARTTAGMRLTRQQRRDQLRIRAASLRDLRQLWTVVDPVNLTGTFATFIGPAGTVVAAGRRLSAEAAADYFDRFRIAEGFEEGGITGLADAVPALVVQAALRGAGLAGILRARRAGFPPAAAARSGFVKVAGQATSLVLAGARETIAARTDADPRAQGWRRVTSSDPCDFCRRLAGSVHGS